MLPVEDGDTTVTRISLTDSNSDAVVGRSRYSLRLTSALEWCHVSVATKTSRNLSTIVSWTVVLLFESDLTLSQPMRQNAG